MSSGAKQIFSSTLPHSDNCAWEGFFTCSLRVVSVWAHSMQLISFTTKSYQIFSLEWKYNICCDLHTRITVTCWQSGWAPHDFCHRFIVSHNLYLHKYMYVHSLLETCGQKYVQLVTGVYSNVSNCSWNKSWCVSQAGKPSASPRFLHGLWRSFRRSSLWKFSHNFPAEIQEK